MAPGRVENWSSGTTASGPPVGARARWSLGGGYEYRASGHRLSRNTYVSDLLGHLRRVDADLGGEQMTWQQKLKGFSTKDMFDIGPPTSPDVMHSLKARTILRRDSSGSGSARDHLARVVWASRAARVALLVSRVCR